ncbi:SusC/RagA family TonB-linked outer membrane protein [Sphingobacterium sp. LRF_L2]|uniref:SusC/RagA family TonB-linked outer membrane protein n=1 Tax=Sphingobacterium sp. LRF_L2 TaxID=3369421 RepID=UPI003F605C76
MNYQAFLKKGLLQRSLRFLCPLIALLPSTVLASKLIIESSIHSLNFVGVTGKVLGPDGKPVAGATVLVKGTKAGVKTDENGIFHINLPMGNEIIIVSYVGYKVQEIDMTGKSEITVRLESTDSIDEVVVVGYGNQKKDLLTYNAQSVNMDAIKDLPVGSLSATLRGQMVGVSVSGGQSRPGDNAAITIRNPAIYSKDGGDLRPIYVIDDVVKTEDDFNNLDASEVESMTVLKDVGAAIYGVSGSQGAIVVKTKRGKVGIPQINYSGSLGGADAVMLSKMMTGYEQASYLNDYYDQNPSGTSSTSYYTDDELAYFKEHNYNWLDMAWKPSLVSRHNVNVSGGGDNATYFAGASYNKQDGNLDNINVEKWSFRASSDVTLARGLKLGLQVSGDLYKKNMYWLKQGGESAEKDVLSLLQMPQFIPPYINGLPVLTTTSTSSSTQNFHFFEVQNSDNYTKTNDNSLNVNFNLNYAVPFVKGLNAKILYNKNIANSFGKQYGTTYQVYRFSGLGTNNHIYGGDVASTVTLTNGDMIRFNPTYTTNYQLNGSINYANSFGKHHVSAMAMFEQRESYSDGVATYKEDPILGGSDNVSYAVGTSVLQSESESESGYLSYIGRVNYNYDDRYLFEATLRVDGSTNFSPENRWGYFPSFSAGWIVSRESFFSDNISWMDFFKVRAALGFSGADRTRGFQWYDRYKSETGKGAVFGGNADRTLTIVQDGISNRDVTWDSMRKYSVGIESRFLKDRLSFSWEGYFDHGYDMLTQLTSSISLLVGQQLPSENYTNRNAFGTEFSLSWHDKINENWKYSVNSFFGWSDDKLLKGDVSSGLIGTFRDPIGKSTDMGVLGFDYLGMFRTQEEVDNYLSANPGYTIFGDTPKPGMLYYRDIDGDGVITEDGDLTYIAPKSSNHYNLGFNFSIGYKSLNLAVTSGMSWGGQSLVEGDARKVATVNINRPAFWADHWSTENTDAKYPAPYYSNTYDRTSQFWFRSSTTVSISNINLSYTLPTSINKRIGVNSVRAFLVSTNPFVLYNPYKDYRSSSSSYNVYPELKTWSLGLSIGF